MFPFVLAVALISMSCSSQVAIACVCVCVCVRARVRVLSRWFKLCLVVLPIVFIFYSLDGMGSCSTHHSWSKHSLTLYQVPSSYWANGTLLEKLLYVSLRISF